jgi:molecular chaperone HtpG
MKLEKTSLKRVDADVLEKLIEKEDLPKHQLSDDELKKLKRYSIKRSAIRI